MRIILFGKQGSGKGTFGDFLSNKLNVPHISTGELVRKVSEEVSEMGVKVKDLIDNGNLVPDEIMIKILKKRFEEEDCKDGFVLDGFPRNLDQAHSLEEMIELDVVFVLNISDEVAVTRLMSRRQCRDCSKIFNVLTNKPKEEGKCDDCSGELYIREDDNEEAIRKRIEIYKSEEADLIEFYHAIIRMIDAEKPIEEIHNVLERYISELKQ